MDCLQLLYPHRGRLYAIGYRDFEYIPSLLQALILSLFLDKQAGPENSD